jgi:hypothetical protein
MNWGYRIKAITVVLQITEHGALPCTSTKKNKKRFGSLNCSIYLCRE